MKKILTYAVMSLLALCFMAPGFATKAEAAKLAVVPLIVSYSANEQDATDPEGSMKGMIYTDAVVNQFTYPDFDLVDSEIVKRLAEEQTDIFTKEAMEKIANESGADIVLAMSVDRFESDEDHMHKEDRLFVHQRGKIISYNKITGKLKNTTWRNDNDEELAAVAKSDWAHDEFGRTVRRLMKSIIKL